MLVQLSEADWHFKHEDVVGYLSGYDSPLVVSALRRATEWIPDYLDFDDNRALARKAIWELGKQPGGEARHVLEQLAMSDDELIRDAATHQLRR